MKIALKNNMKLELEYLTHKICSKKVNGKITEFFNLYLTEKLNITWESITLPQLKNSSNIL